MSEMSAHAWLQALLTTVGEGVKTSDTRGQVRAGARPTRHIIALQRSGWQSGHYFCIVNVSSAWRLSAALLSARQNAFRADKQNSNHDEHTRHSRQECYQTDQIRLPQSARSH